MKKGLGERRDAKEDGNHGRVKGSGCRVYSGMEDKWTLNSPGAIQCILLPLVQHCVPQ